MWTLLIFFYIYAHDIYKAAKLYLYVCLCRAYILYMQMHLVFIFNIHCHVDNVQVVVMFQHL